MTLCAITRGWLPRARHVIGGSRTSHRSASEAAQARELHDFGTNDPKMCMAGRCSEPDGWTKVHLSPGSNRRDRGSVSQREGRPCTTMKRLASIIVALLAFTTCAHAAELKLFTVRDHNHLVGDRTGL